MSFVSPEARGEETLDFVCVKTGAGMRIDLDRTLRNVFGASPDDLLETMKEAIVSSGEATEPPEEPGEDDPLDRSDFDRDRLSDDFKAGLSSVSPDIDKQVWEIEETMETQDIVWEIAWGTMPMDGKAPLRLLRSVFTPLRYALSTLERRRAEAPGEPEGTGMAKVRAGIRSIRIVSVNDHRFCGCSLKDGRLTLRACLMEGNDPYVPVQGLELEEIEWAIRDSLDLDVGPTIRGTEAVIADFVDQCRRNIGFEPRVTVDWESFRAFGHSKEVLGALEVFRCYLLKSLHLVLKDLQGRFPWAECLESIHFQRVGSIGEKSVRLEGKHLVFHLFYVEEREYFSSETLGRVLQDLSWELPKPPVGPPEAGEVPSADETGKVADEAEEVADETTVEPEEAPAARPEAGPAPGGAPEAEDREARVKAFRQTVESMERDMLPGMRRQLSDLFGKEVGLDIDWDSLEADPDRFDLVVTGVMGMVLAALMNLAFYPESKGPVIAAVNAVRMLYDGRVQGVALTLEGGVLTTACGGPAAAYTQDFEAMLEGLRQLVSAWEEGSRTRG